MKRFELLVIQRLFAMRLFCVVVFSIYVINSYSQSQVQGGEIGGVWTKSASPYKVYGDITIPGDSILQIEPGVVVEFQGHYKLKVQGRLLAQGVLGDSIVFTVKDTTGLSVDSIPDGSWGGIRFEDNSSTDSSRIEYCKVHYGKVMYPEDSCGGGIYVKDFSRLVITNSNVSYNRITSNELSKYFEEDDKTIIHKGNAFGGGIYCSNSSIKIYNCHIKNNLILTRYAGVGGGLFIDNGSLKLFNNRIFNNTIIGSTSWFRDNLISGGGVYTNNIVLEVFNNEFYNNLIIKKKTWLIEQGEAWYDIEKTCGGGIAISNSLGYLIKNQFIKNNCIVDKGAGGAYGGGIFILESELNIEKNNIIDNYCKGGDALCCNMGEGGTSIGAGLCVINNTLKSLIINNIIMKNNGKAGLTGDSEDGCSEAYGGGIFSCKNSLIIKNIINDNSLIKDSECNKGAGIYAIEDNLIMNNLINNNYGGGIYSQKKIYIYNNTILSNINFVFNYYNCDCYYEGPGIHIDNVKGSEIINNIIRKNTSHICFYDGWANFDTIIDPINQINKNLKVSYSNVMGGYPGTGNINQEPQFIGLGDHPYMLAPGSPCINRGCKDTAGLNLPAADLAGNARISFGRIDIGAYEAYRGSLVTGTVYYDKANPGVKDTNEYGLKGQILKIEPGAFYTTTDENGDYYFLLNNGTYTITCYPQNPWEFSNPKTSYTVEITDSGSFVNKLDFGITTTKLTHNTGIYLAGSATRCSFESSYWLGYKNIGTETERGKIKFQYDSLLTYISSEPAPVNVNKNNLEWDFDSLKFLEERQIRLMFKIPGLTYTDDTLKSYTSIEIEEKEIDESDNRDTLLQVVVCAIDPNDKAVSPAGVEKENYTLKGDKLLYTIRFQNTGTDTAYNIKITDTISDKLKPESFRLLSSSHPVRYEITGSNLLTFYFDFIMLPDSNKNQALSNGYVKFSIQPKDSLEENTIVSNTADIYFDYNPEVRTNRVFNTYVSILPLKIKKAANNPGNFNIIIYPNPAKDRLNIEIVSRGGNRNIKIKLQNMQGQELMEESLQNTSVKQNRQIDLSDIARGVYILSITGDSETKVFKIIRE